MKYFGFSLILSAVLLSGCSTLSLDEAGKLGSAGTLTATAIQNESATVVRELAAYEEREAFSRIYTQFAPCKKPCKNQYNRSSESEEGKEKFQEKLKYNESLTALTQKRADTFKKLSETYVAFEKLVHFNAAEEAEKAMGDLIDSTNALTAEYNKLENKKIVKVEPIKDNAKSITQVAFGLIGEEIHKSKVKEASRLLRGAVSALTVAIKNEESYQTALRVGIALKKKTMLEILRKENAVSVGDELAVLIKELGAQPVSNLNQLVAKSVPLKTTMTEILETRWKKEFAAIDTRYAHLIQGLAQLELEHQKLEEGKPVTVANIIAQAKHINEAYKRVHK